MAALVIKLLPIFAGFGVAFVIKKLGWAGQAQGRWLLKLSLYVTIPALIVVSVSKVGFSRQLLVFPALSWIIVIVTVLVMHPMYKRLRLPRATEGTFRIAPLTINSAFTLPFLLAVFGSVGATRVVLFNAGYNPLLLIGVYGLAASYNPGNKRRRDVLARILILPPFWALLAGLVLNASHTPLPVHLAQALQFVGNLTGWLTIAALGLMFNPQRIRLDKTLGILGLRMGVGLIIGVAAVLLLHLQGVDRAAVLALAAAPIGFNLLTFTSVEKLDHELAASAVSLSLLAGLCITPLIVVLAR